MDYNDPEYQPRRYYMLVIGPINQVIPDHSPVTADSVHRLNQAIKESVARWVADTNIESGAQLTEEQFLWEAEYNPIQQAIQAKQMPDILKQMEKGEADLNALAYPTPKEPSKLKS